MRRCIKEQKRLQSVRRAGNVGIKKRWLMSGLLTAAFMAALMGVEMAGEGQIHAWWPLSGQVIVIDPGHGGPDGGAVSPTGLVEKDVALDVAFYLRDYLQQAGALVRMTREGDYDLARPQTRGYSRRKTEDLKRRAAIVQESGADLVVSIHLNSFRNARYRGAQAFFSTKQEDSRRLAEAVQQELIASLGNTKRTAKKLDEIFLLNQSPVPAVLVEIGFLSHQEEVQLLAQPEYQRKVAAAIYRGMLRFYVDEKDNRPTY
ncbi:MAG: N-acetylmuramoyl-L-alanine amidase CwlD [Bacillaceae bacterium G1]|nr:MAG: N-acetylmuramoyl-L-alanine amidase CwlD [Bacillaceae bacterium G1]